MSVADQLAKLGIDLPKPALPVANYVPYKLVNGLLYLSGQIPLVAGQPQVTGRLGAEVTLEEGVLCARIATLNALGWINSALDGDLERVREVIRVRGFVASTAGFYDQPKVLNGCSDLLVEVFGERGRHTRCAYGTVVLPLNVPVELDFIFSVA